MTLIDMQKVGVLLRHILPLILVYSGISQAQNLNCPKPAPTSEIFTVESKFIQGQLDRFINFSGSVSANHPDFNLSADEILVNVEDDSITSTSRLYVQHQNIRLWGTGFASNKNSFDVDQSILTLCEGEQQDLAWRIESSRTHFDKNDQTITSHNAVLEFQDIPIFYSPYLKFSLRRRSGLLFPSFGYYQPTRVNSTKQTEGLYYHQGYYLNLAPNYDVTVYATALQNRGLLTSGEFRYLQSHSEGTLRGAYLQNDPLLRNNTNGGENLSTYAWKNKTTVNENLKFSVDWAAYNPRYIYQTLPSIFDDEQTASKDRHVRVTYATKASRTHVSVQDNISLINPQQDGLVRLPQIEHWQYIDRQGASRFTIRGQVSNFSRPASRKNDDQLTSGKRIVFNPYWQWIKPANQYRLIVETGGRYNHYQLQQNRDEQNFDFSNAYLHTGGSLYFDNTPDFFRKALSLTFEPSLHYVFSPYVKQSHLPDFDTSTKPITRLQQLYDPVELNGDDGLRESNRVVAIVKQRYHLTNSTAFGHLAAGRSVDISTPTVSRERPVNDSWFLESSFTVDRVLFETLSQWDLDVSDPTYINSNVLYDGDSHDVRVNYLHQSTLTETLQYFSAGVSVDLNTPWQLHALSNYNITNQRLDHSLIGFTYDDCCWQFNTAIARKYNNLNNVSAEASTEIIFELVLKGLASLGPKDSRNRMFDQSQGFSP